jgi:hypothetical protein
MTRTRPSGAIRRTVALIPSISAAAAFLERLSCFSTWWRIAISYRPAFSRRFAISLCFAMSLDCNDAAFAIGEGVLARFAGRRLPANVGRSVGAMILAP